MIHSVELAHVYREELRTKGVPAWQERLEADRLLVAMTDVALVFVDDYPDAYSQPDKDRVAEVLYAHALKAGIPLDAVCFESSCATAADELAANLPLAENWLWKQGTGHWRATLLRDGEDGPWKCAALSAIWTLARLGVEPYMEAVLSEATRWTDRFEADTVTTVLPTTYIDNEAAVVEVLRQLRTPRISLSRVRYVFS